MNQHKQCLLLYILPLVAVFFSLVMRINYLESIILFWGIPSLLLTIWARQRAVKVALIALSATVFFMALDIIFYMTRQWYVLSTVFNNRLLGVVAWEDILYFFLFAYFPIIFWEHFYERQVPEQLWTKSMTRLTFIFVLFLLVVLAAWSWAPVILQIPYFYLISTVLLMVIPLALELWSHPRFSLKFLRVGLYFAYVAILYELTALYLGLWKYPSSQFVGWVEIVGLRFPIEELFAWILLGAVAILSWYEYFDDDNR